MPNKRLRNLALNSVFDGALSIPIDKAGIGEVERMLLSTISTAISGNFELVNDLTPQLGGQLDVNGQSIGDGTRELITFVEDGSAVNHVEIENQATGNGPILRSTGDDANVDLNLATKGTGLIKLESDVGIKKDAGSGDSNLSFLDVAGTTREGRIYFDTNSDMIIETDVNNRQMIFKINDGGVDTEAMIISGSLNRVSIGDDTTPDYHLEVNGSGIQDIGVVSSSSSFSGYNLQNSAHHYSIGINKVGTGHFTIFDETNSLARLHILDTGLIGIGETSPTAQLHIDQSSATGAIPPLLIKQTDVDQEMIELDGTTIGVGNAIEAVGAKTLTVTHFVKCTINPGGLTRYIQAGTIA